MGVPIAWHEAVALVRVLAVAVLQQAPPLELPRLSHILIDADGDLVATGSDVLGDDAVPHLREALAALLDTDSAPAELVSLAYDSDAEEPPPSLTEFIARLTFFARPDDSVELATLAARGLAYRESHFRDEALASLARKARGATPPDTSADTLKKSRKGLGMQAAVLFGALVTLAVIAVPAWRFVASRPAQPSATPTPSAEVARHVQDPSASTTSTLQGQAEVTPQPGAPRGRDRELPTVRRQASRAAVAAAPSPAAGLSSSGEAVAARATTPSASGVGAPARQEGSPVIGAPDTTVYSAQDAGVTRPVLVRPQMPAVRIEGLTQEAAGELELLVGTDGRVEQARLVPASSRYQDRMMISASKTWRFDPARKDGSPVRYRLRIPITW
jgi:outer membrane biosynthesis protein TonB